MIRTVAVLLVVTRAYADPEPARLAIGGLFQLDGRLFVDDAADPHVDQLMFRSLRVELSGTVYDHFELRVLPDFAGGKLTLQDSYVDIHYCDQIEVRVGKFKVPFGLERLQQDRYTTFVERGLPSQLTPNRDLGVEVFGELARGAVAYQLGVFDGTIDGQSVDGDISDDKELAARVFVRPFATGLGFGAAATIGDKTGTLAAPYVPQFTTQGGTTFFQYKVGGTSLMDTVVADGRHWRATGQASWYTGPVAVLGEYVRSVQHVVLDGTHDNVAIDAWQVLGQWVLTGEDTSTRSVTPRHPFDPATGAWGAFDVAARIGELRLVDGSVFDGGFADPTKAARRAWSAGGGADWFANRAIRVALDLEHTWYTLGGKLGDRSPETSIIGRFQAVF